MSTSKNLKRISLMIGEDQYQALTDRGLNISGLIRDLVADYLSDHKITVGVTEATRGLYDEIVANTGSTDEDVEEYFRVALRQLLDDKIKRMQSLQAKAFERK
jgi:hypothetical protein